MSHAVEQPPTSRPAWSWLALIVLVYVLLAALYAAKVPAWQAPDEPAHYNYIHELATTGHLPVLRMGDYDQAYLERLRSERFPAGLPIHPVRYEAHQPPAYYLLASAVFRLTQGQLLFLRLFSVVLGALFILLTYAIVRLIFPQRARLQLAAAAFVAFLPMHVASAASVNNDALAEVVLAALLLLALRYLQRWLLGPARPGWLDALLIGVLLGLALVTKVSAYVAVPLLVVVLVIAWYEARRSALPPAQASTLLATFFAQAVLIFVPALLIALPWYARNAQVYGNLDILGRRWHDTVVVGQLRTGELLAQAGLGSVLERFFVWSHDSFWGVFGWMGVWMDGRVYTALLAFSLAVGVGCVALAARRVVGGGWRVERGEWSDEVSSGGASGAATADDSVVSPLSTVYSPPFIRFRRWSLALLALSALLTLAIFVSYNALFVQPQGRYLFPALPVIALAVALGWEETLRPRTARWAAGVLLVTAALAGGLGFLTAGVSKWSVVILGGAGLALAGWSLGIPRMPAPWRARLAAIAFAAPFAALPLLDLVALYGVILPQLA